MGSTGPTTAIIPINLGTAAAFNQNIFPLEYREGGDNLSKGSFLIKATLDEMEKIAKLGIDLNKNDDFIFNTRLNLEDLRATEAKLLDGRKTFNPFKAFLNYRTARLFHARSRALYLDTKRTSEKIHREEVHVSVVPTTTMRAVDGVIPPNAIIGGISMDLPHGYNDYVRQLINDATTTMATTDPFDDNPLISQLRDGEQVITLDDTTSSLCQDVSGSGAAHGNQKSVTSTSSDLQSRPSSSQTINIIHLQIQDSIFNTNSDVNELTVNHNSQNSDGEPVAQ